MNNILDINECDDTSANECQKNADCVNTIGGYKCDCKQGFKGNGLFCEGTFILLIVCLQIIRPSICRYQ